MCYELGKRAMRISWGSISSEQLMCGGGVHRILLLPLVARNHRCVYMAHVCFMSAVVTVGVCGNVCVGNVMDAVFSA